MHLFSTDRPAFCPVVDESVGSVHILIHLITNKLNVGMATALTSGVRRMPLLYH